MLGQSPGAVDVVLYDPRLSLGSDYFPMELREIPSPAYHHESEGTAETFPMRVPPPVYNMQDNNTQPVPNIIPADGSNAAQQVTSDESSSSHSSPEARAFHFLANLSRLSMNSNGDVLRPRNPTPGLESAHSSDSSTSCLSSAFEWLYNGNRLPSPIVDGVEDAKSYLGSVDASVDSDYDTQDPLQESWLYSGPSDPVEHGPQTPEVAEEVHPVLEDRDAEQNEDAPPPALAIANLEDFLFTVLAKQDNLQAHIAYLNEQAEEFDEQDPLIDENQRLSEQNTRLEEYIRLFCEFPNTAWTGRDIQRSGQRRLREDNQLLSQILAQVRTDNTLLRMSNIRHKAMNRQLIAAITANDSLVTTIRRLARAIENVSATH